MHWPYTLYLVGADKENSFNKADLDISDTVVTSTNCSGDETQYGQCYHNIGMRNELPCDGYTSVYCQGKCKNKLSYHMKNVVYCFRTITIGTDNAIWDHLRNFKTTTRIRMMSCDCEV